MSKRHGVYLRRVDTIALMAHAMDLQVHGVIVDDPAWFVESTNWQPVSRISALCEWVLTKCARLAIRRYGSLKHLLPYLNILMTTYHTRLPLTELWASQGLQRSVPTPSRSRKLITNRIYAGSLSADVVPSCWSLDHETFWQWNSMLFAVGHFRADARDQRWSCTGTIFKSPSSLAEMIQWKTLNWELKFFRWTFDLTEITVRHSPCCFHWHFLVTACFSAPRVHSVLTTGGAKENSKVWSWGSLLGLLLAEIRILVNVQMSLLRARFCSEVLRQAPLGWRLGSLSQPVGVRGCLGPGDSP